MNLEVFSDLFVKQDFSWCKLREKDGSILLYWDGGRPTSMNVMLKEITGFIEKCPGRYYVEGKKAGNGSKDTMCTYQIEHGNVPVLQGTVGQVIDRDKLEGTIRKEIEQEYALK